MNKNRMDEYLRILKKNNTGLYDAAQLTLHHHQEYLDDVVFEISALVSGPLLFNYVTWVILEANNKNIKRLYFLARDGYIMYQIAILICNHYNINIECKYLYSSRIAWRVPQYHILGETCIEQICIGGIDVTLDKVMDRAILTEQEKKEVINVLGITDYDVNKVLTRNELNEYKLKLVNCKEFMNFVYNHSINQYKLAIGYFEQEGLFEEIKYAIVDTGWTGSMQYSLYKLLQSKNPKIILPYGFYFGIFNLPKDVLENKFLSFYFSKNKGMLRKVFFNNNIIECICCSKDGMTRGYEKVGGKYVPCFETRSNVNLSKWPVELQINTIIKYAENAINCIDVNKWNYRKEIKLSFELCKKFMVFPNKEEATAYGSYNFSDDITEKSLQLLAISMNKKELNQNLVIYRILNRLNFRHYELPYKQSCWHDGTIAKSETKFRMYYVVDNVIFRWIKYIKDYLVNLNL